MADGHEENRYLPIRAAGGSSVNEFFTCMVVKNDWTFTFQTFCAHPQFPVLRTYIRNQIKLSLRPLFEGPPLTLTTFIIIYLLFIIYSYICIPLLWHIKPAAFVNAIHSLSKITLYRIARFLNSYVPQKAQKRYRVWYVKIKLKGASLSDRDVKKRLVYKNSDTKTFFKWTSSKQAPRLWRALPPPSCGSIPVHQRSPPPLSL